jgi:hypothetical protein
MPAAVKTRLARSVGVSTADGLRIPRTGDRDLGTDSPALIMRARRKHRDDVTATILASIALMFGGMALLTIGTVRCSSGTDARRNVGHIKSHWGGVTRLRRG